MVLRAFTALYLSVAMFIPPVYAQKADYQVDYSLVGSVPGDRHSSGSHRELQKKLRDSDPAKSYQVISYYEPGETKSQNMRRQEAARQKAEQMRKELHQSGVRNQQIDVKVEQLEPGEKPEVKIFAEKPKKSRQR